VPNQRRGRLLVAIAILVLLLPTANVAAAERPRRAPRGAVTVVTIKIVDNRFRHGTITIDRGTVVKWKNRGDNTHTTTSDTGVWNSGNLSPGETFRRRFRQAGTFAYHCAIHSTMRGTITVV